MWPSPAILILPASLVLAGIVGFFESKTFENETKAGSTDDSSNEQYK